MSLLIYGINHKSAPIAVRECLAFDQKKSNTAVERLLEMSPANEAVLLSTCNRTEVVIHTDSVQEMHLWMRKHLRDYAYDIVSVGYAFQDEAAVKHLIRVATGLDSMVLGEPQILGQLKKVYAQAAALGHAGDNLCQLFPAVFSFSKQIRSTTELGKNPVTIAYAVVQLIKKIRGSLDSLNVLLVGTGDMMELMATHLCQHSVSRLTVANRTVDKAQGFVEQFGAKAICMSDIPAHLPSTDVLISATASQLPLIGKGMVEQALKAKTHQLPLVMVDLAVPRDIEPQINELDAVELYDMDAIESAIRENLQSRERSAQQAESMVAIKARHYIQSMRVFGARELIQQFRGQLESIRDRECAIALEALDKGRNPREVIVSLSRKITNKMLHRPTCGLRQAAYDSEAASFKVIKELFELS
jgi:glutamyl-tRNA reductase